MIKFVDNDVKIVLFKHIVEGNAFRYRGSHFMKIYDPEGDHNAVLLENGTLQYFDDYDNVIEINLEIHVMEVKND